MRILELFAGTKSVGKAFEALGWEVTSVDILPTFGATITADVLAWDYEAHAPPGHYDFVWASPPCTQYSRARTTAKTPRDLEGADGIVRRALDIVQYFQPRAWLMENPQTGLLKSRDVVAGLPFRDVTYCKYGYLYRKATRLWGNLDFEPRDMCTHHSPCNAKVGRRHPEVAQARGIDGYTTIPKERLYSIPPQLCEDIAGAATRLMV